LREEFEQLHQSWRWSGLARFGPTTPKRATTSLAASVDPNEASNCPRTDFVSHSVPIGHCEIGGFE
jgi:hypothetical protein